MKGNCAVILAAGEGTRMKSKKPKVLAEVLYTPMIDWVIDSAKACALEEKDICVVTGHGKELLCAHLPQGIATVEQTQRLGTGHAVLQAKDFIQKHGSGNVLVLNGDAPLMDEETVSCALEYHTRCNAAVTVISAAVEDPTGYGRIVRDARGDFAAIVEERDATDEQRAICEVNSGAYWFDCQALLVALDRLQSNAACRRNSAGECYLTDAVSILRSMRQKVMTFTAQSADVVRGANDRIQLAALNEIARMRIINHHRKNGVSIPFADGIVIAPGVQIGRDAEILRGTTLKGSTVIAEDALIGPDTTLDSCTVGEGAVLLSVYGENATIGAGTRMGPFTHLRPGTVVGKDVRVGNFVEIKNSNIGDEAKVSHLSYIGDTDMGPQVNVGCGCATANFTGKEKFRTTIGEHAFIGCDTTLVAPVTVGDRAYTASGSVITEDVPDDALALGRARQVIKRDWVKIKKPYRE